MKYLMPTFTCPASNNANQLDWDRAFLNDEEFAAKYHDELSASNSTANLPQSTVKYYS